MKIADANNMFSAHELSNLLKDGSNITELVLLAKRAAEEAENGGQPSQHYEDDYYPEDDYYNHQRGGKMPPIREDRYDQNLVQCPPLCKSFGLQIRVLWHLGQSSIWGPILGSPKGQQWLHRWHVQSARARLLQQLWSPWQSCHSRVPWHPSKSRGSSNPC